MAQSSSVVIHKQLILLMDDGKKLKKIHEKISQQLQDLNEIFKVEDFATHNFEKCKINQAIETVCQVLDTTRRLKNLVDRIENDSVFVKNVLK